MHLIECGSKRSHLPYPPPTPREPSDLKWGDCGVMLGKTEGAVDLVNYFWIQVAFDDCLNAEIMSM